MQFDLEILEDLVLNKVASFESNADLETLGEWLCVAVTFKEKFRGALLKTIFSHQEDKQTSRFIQYVQSRLIFLSDKLFRIIFSQDKNPDYLPSQPLDLLNLQKSVYLILEEMIGTLEKDFHQHFNFDERILERQELLAIQDFQNKISLLKEQLDNVDNRLLTFIFSPFQKIISQSETPLTLRRLHYLNKLLNELLKIPCSIEANEKTELLKQKLIYYNFNSWRFFHYLTEEIIHEVQLEETKKDQLLKYHYHLKCINQTFFESGKFLNPNREPLHDLLTQWLSDEIYYLEKQIQLNGSTNILEKELTNSNFKVQTSLSVPQLAYLIRLFIRIGVITNKTLTDLMRFLSSHIQTKQSDELGSESLYKRFYENSDSSKRVVKTLVIKLLNEINDN